MTNVQTAAAKAAYSSLGSGRFLVGDPFLANGEGMIDLGEHETVGYTSNLRAAYRTSANTNDIPAPDSLRTIPAMPSFQVELHNQSQQALLNALGAHVELVQDDPDNPTAEAVVRRPVTRKLNTVTAVFIPDIELPFGADAQHAVWVPSAFPANVDGLFQYGRLQDGANNNPYTLTMNGTRNPAGFGTNITEIWGPPAAANLAWSLPENLDQTA